LKVRVQGAQAAAPAAKSCILLWLDGGPSHLETFDLKPDAPREVRGPFSPISTTVPGLEISELLPQTAGSLAIVPAQMKMVYDIGKRHGIELDRRAVKDFGAALGIGAVTQVLEGGLRKLLSGVLGGLGGKTGENVGDLTGGVAGGTLTFATTYALGAVADRYYASGRKMELSMLKEEFTKLVETAKTKGTEYSTGITAKARELSGKFQGMDISKILGGLLPGKPAA
jgi:uncharacterized protein (DUF697 family)